MSKQASSIDPPVRQNEMSTRVGASDDNSGADARRSLSSQQPPSKGSDLPGKAAIKNNAPTRTSTLNLKAPGQQQSRSSRSPPKRMPPKTPPYIQIIDAYSDTETDEEDADSKLETQRPDTARENCIPAAPKNGIEVAENSSSNAEMEVEGSAPVNTTISPATPGSSSPPTSDISDIPDSSTFIVSNGVNDEPERKSMVEWVGTASATLEGQYKFECDDGECEDPKRTVSSTDAYGENGGTANEKDHNTGRQRKKQKRSMWDRHVEYDPNSWEVATSGSIHLARRKVATSTTAADHVVDSSTLPPTQLFSDMKELKIFVEPEQTEDIGNESEPGSDQGVVIRTRSKSHTPIENNEGAIIRVGQEFQATNFPEARPDAQVDHSSWGVKIWDPRKAADAIASGEKINEFLDEAADQQRRILRMEALHQTGYSTKAAIRKAAVLFRKRPPVLLTLVDGKDKHFDELMCGALGRKKDFKTISEALDCRMESILVNHYRWKATSKKYRRVKKARKKDYCAICDDGGTLIVCETCRNAYHLECLVPPLNDIPEGSWYCNNCTNNKSPATNRRLSLSPRTPVHRVRHPPESTDVSPLQLTTAQRKNLFNVHKELTIKCNRTNGSKEPMNGTTTSVIPAKVSRQSDTMSKQTESVVTTAAHHQRPTSTFPKRTSFSYSATLPVTPEGLLIQICEDRSQLNGITTFLNYRRDSNGDAGPAERSEAIYSEGDVVSAVNGVSCLGKTYNETIALLTSKIPGETEKILLMLHRGKNRVTPRSQLPSSKYAVADNANMRWSAELFPFYCLAKPFGGRIGQQEVPLVQGPVTRPMDENDAHKEITVNEQTTKGPIERRPNIHQEVEVNEGLTEQRRNTSKQKDPPLTPQAQAAQTSAAKEVIGTSKSIEQTKAPPGELQQNRVAEHPATTTNGDDNLNFSAVIPASMQQAVTDANKAVAALPGVVNLNKIPEHLSHLLRDRPKFYAFLQKKKINTVSSFLAMDSKAMAMDLMGTCDYEVARDYVGAMKTIVKERNCKRALR